MAINELWRLEEKLWLEGAPVYERHLAADGVMVVPGVGIMERKAVIDSVSERPRWEGVTMSGQHVARWDEVIVLAYVASAERSTGERYGALCSSTYADRHGRWMLLSHQQTPI